MWKYIGIVAALFVLAGLGAATTPEECVDCYSNVVKQTTEQAISNIGISPGASNTVTYANEGMLSGVIVTQFSEDKGKGKDEKNLQNVAFGTIVQDLDQQICGVSTSGIAAEVMNKEIAAAWIQGQGRKEKEADKTVLKEGAYVEQGTLQTIGSPADPSGGAKANLINADSKLAMIVDDMEAVIDIAAKATSETSETAESNAAIENSLDVNVNGGKDDKK